MSTYDTYHADWNITPRAMGLASLARVTPTLLVNQLYFSVLELNNLVFQGLYTVHVFTNATQAQTDLATVAELSSWGLTKVADDDLLSPSDMRISGHFPLVIRPLNKATIKLLILFTKDSFNGRKMNDKFTQTLDVQMMH